MMALLRTAQLDAGALAEVRRLLDAAFRGERFGDDDWRHALGGVHALVRNDSRLVAHGALVPRSFLHAGRPLRVGYVEAVAVHPAERRRGLGSAVMAELEDVVRREYDAGALSATEDGAALYRARGWLRWQGTAWALTPAGRIRTAEDDDAVFVLPAVAELDVTGELTCDWRTGDLW
ncbi:GNAT family N-acetyltransferase [Blastococcus sp. LR1]|uniref:GNAT family N-acetyltransferase n=1 Tax=Blastococcus sp. LR1 TaxID=2877000 RepID=UPI001CC96B91|nr:GNAT family N-acetyltransferase [Blastococcus sp. LR1]MCA0143501.1 GNAT family N-acetyltransferase [Blastococcus sp. LR1]